MYRLDRTKFRMGNAADQVRWQHEFWQKKSMEERLAAAHYLNSVAYQFDPAAPPRLDRTKFSMRKHAA